MKFGLEKFKMGGMKRGAWNLHQDYGVEALMLSFYGQKIADEGKRTVRICYRRLGRMQYFQVDNPFFLLAQHATSENLHITAAGFFPIDNSTLVFIAMTVCTYFITALQVL
ncbi:uncharacterized protein LOC132695774 [Cylas formicarius]|uniref:uncharacterized protein LOC132695774 n=1 Tax=Cylas formicarius TaxID=197179 RepID=UPI002958CD6B|nr:uncharacterized protein LOC132695774 [Cylas formicarius]